MGCGRGLAEGRGQRCPRRGKSEGSGPGQGLVSSRSSHASPLPCTRYITQQGNKLETGRSRVPPTVTNAVSWRSEGLKYKKNEVFIDVIESVNLLVSANGSVLLSEVVGSIKLKVFLSGMPELRLGLNDRVLFELTGRKHWGALCLHPTLSLHPTPSLHPICSAQLGRSAARAHPLLAQRGAAAALPLPGT